MNRYYKGGYYLIKTKPFNFGAVKGEIVTTCSNCINLSVFDQLHRSWVGFDQEERNHELGLTEEKVSKISDWADEKLENGANVLPHLQAALELKELFFRYREDIRIYSIDFPERDAELLIMEYQGVNSLRHNIEKKISANQNNGEEFLGYDFIGLEGGGSFHSFYCHDIRETLIERFDLKLNQHGLFAEVKNRETIREYLRDSETAVEPVRWYIVRVNRETRQY